ncbi:MAG: DNA-directed RNA polymerase subunit alpha [bacterium]
MKWKNLHMPKGLQADAANTDGYGKFTLEPLERGFGTTVGNALRRVLLSSLQGAAITSVRIEGVLHEFSTLPGVVEDVADVVLNLKKVRLKLHGDGPKSGLFEMRGKGEVTAGDLKVDADVEVLNKDQVIATLNRDGDLRMEVTIEGGRGYVSNDQHSMTDRPIGVIPVDSLFSPVTKVNIGVEQTRMGHRIDYDKLTLEVWTDGSINANDAVSMSSKILRDHFQLLISFEHEPEQEDEKPVDEESARRRKLFEKSVEELELSVRSSNCLRAAEIKTLGELVQKTESEMLKFRNFGRKSLKEITDILHELGLSWGMDVSNLEKVSH